MAERNPNSIDSPQNQETPSSADRIKRIGVLLTGIGLVVLTGAGFIYNPEVTKAAIAIVAFGITAVAIGGITAINRN